MSLLLVGVFLAGLVVTAAPAQAAATTSVLIDRGSSRCLDDRGTPANGVQQYIYDCLPGEANQKYTYTGAKELRIAGKCLGASNNAITNGTAIVTFTCNSSLSQQWTLGTDESIINDLSGLCMGVTGGATTNRSPVALFTCSGATSQRWFKQSTSTLVGQGSGRCLDGGGLTSGVQQYVNDCVLGQPSQQYTYTSAQELRIASECLGADNNGTTNGTRVIIFNCNSSPSQKWTFTNAGSITNDLSGLCMGVTAAATANGSGVALSSCTGSSSQIWARVGRITQAVTFTPTSTATLGAGTIALGGTADSGLTVTYASSTPPICTVSGSTLTLLSNGACTVSANQAGDSTYEPASVTRSIVVSAAQTITFTPPATATLGTGTLALVASATSGLTVTFTSSTTGVCTVAGSTLTFLSTGTCTVHADQAGDSGYQPATTLTRSIVVSAAQTITFAPPATATLGTGTLALVASATSGLTVTFTSSTTGVCTVAGSTLTFLSTGTCTIDADQAGDASYLPADAITSSIAVFSIQTIFFMLPAHVALETKAITLTGTADSGLAVAHVSSTPSVCSVDGLTLTLRAAGICIVTASQAGSSSYLPAAAVTRATTVSSLSSPPARVLTSVGTGDAPQNVIVGLEPGDSLDLLDADHHPVTTFSVTGIGDYRLSRSDATITFHPALGYIGTTKGVVFRITDGQGRTTEGTYAPVVRRPPAPRPHSLTSTSTGESKVKVVLERGWNIHLLTKSNHTATRVATEGEGSYQVVPGSGTIIFIPASHFTGKTAGVRFRVNDAYGQAGDARYTPVVSVRQPKPLPVIDRSTFVRAPSNPAHLTGAKRKTTFFRSSFTGLDAWPIAALGPRRLTKNQAISLSSPFGFDKSDLSSSASTELGTLLRSLKKAKTIRCEGYADYEGSLKHERKLSKARAKNVCAELSRNGSGFTTTSRGYGPRRPAVIGATPTRRSENRRVVIVVLR